MRSLSDKTAIITGAASGIGRAIALQMARNHCNLFLIDIDREGLDQICQATASFGIQAHACCIDLANPEAISHAVRQATRQFQAIDILVNNAGICYYGKSTNMRQDQWQRMLAINLAAPMQLVHECLPFLLSQDRSHIVNVASMYGLFVTSKSTTYHATKFGLVGFSEALRAEYKRFGLGVTAVCPGYVQTQLMTSMENSDRRAAQGPPRWMQCSPETVARRTLKAIRRNQRITVITPTANVCYRLRQWFPGMMASIAALGRRKKYDTHLRQLQAYDGEATTKRAA